MTKAYFATHEKLAGLLMDSVVLNPIPEIVEGNIPVTLGDASIMSTR
jgi:hypothetical protein